MDLISYGPACLPVQGAVFTDNSAWVYGKSLLLRGIQSKILAINLYPICPGWGVTSVNGLQAEKLQDLEVEINQRETTGCLSRLMNIISNGRLWLYRTQPAEQLTRDSQRSQTTCSVREETRIKIRARWLLCFTDTTYSGETMFKLRWRFRDGRNHFDNWVILFVETF